MKNRILNFQVLLCKYIIERIFSKILRTYEVYAVWSHLGNRWLIDKESTGGKNKQN